MRPRFNHAAELELDHAASWYEAQRRGLGIEFGQEVEAAIRMILSGPDRWPEVEPGIRRYLVHRFPYGVYYRIGGSEIEITAVADLRRRPGYWRGRS